MGQGSLSRTKEREREKENIAKLFVQLIVATILVVYR